MCTCAFDSTGDLVYASLVKEYCKHPKIQYGIRAKGQLKEFFHKSLSPSYGFLQQGEVIIF